METIRKVGLRREDAQNQARRCEGGCYDTEVGPATPINGDKTLI